MNHPVFELLLSGSGMLYLLKALLAVMALLLRQLSHDPFVRRRGLVVVALLAISALIQTQLTRIPERVSGFVTLPNGEQMSTLVSNPAYQLVSVTMLIISFLALVLLLTMIVDFLLIRKFKVDSPNILRDVAAFTLFFFGVLMILYYRTDLDITGLFTTSAVISVVIGLALQDTLGNVFSGLALQTERSFNVGDWVQFGDFEGVITDITWRSTSLRTRTNDLVIIPNSVISKDTVINYSAPTRIHAITEPIGVHYRHPPADVMAALEEAADHTEGVLKRPRVDVRTYYFGDFAITYDVKYWIRDYTDLEDIKDAFMTHVWYAFNRHGIEIPFPIRNVYLREVTPESEQAEAEADDEQIYCHLKRIDLFDVLSEEEARALAARVRVERYFASETVLRQGAAGDSLYIIEDGLVEVIVSHNGRRERIAQLGQGSFFGEMALLTGAERQASVVALKPTHFFVIDRDAFRDTLEANPDLVERIAQTQAERNQELEATHAALHQAAAEQVEEEKRQILSRIRDFFGFRTTEM